MNGKVERKTVDLSAYPDLVVIYLGIRVNAWTGVKTLLGLGPQIKNSVGRKPDGLLLHEDFIMSLIPLHLGMRNFMALAARKTRVYHIPRGSSLSICSGYIPRASA